jgi:peptidoglycan/LPS O-acetylase OafA/YrhL
MVLPILNQESDGVRFKHHAVLDGVRGIAVLMVIVTHFASLSIANYHYFYAGLLGVDVFFVLSGFLITSILLQEFERTHWINLKRFYVRRFLRLMPAYWACLFLLHFVAPHLLSSWEARQAGSNRTLFFALIYATNWQEVFGDYIGVFTHLWSLAVEEQFYLIWAPLFLALLMKMKNRVSIAGTTLLLIILLFVGLEMKIGLGTVSKEYLYGATDCRLIPLLLGALASMAFLWKKLPAKFVTSRWFDRLALMSFLAAVVLASRFSVPNISTYRVMPWFAMALTIIILWMVTRSRSIVHSALSFPPLLWVGRVSYGLYLWHHFFVAFVRDQAWPMSMKLGVGIALSFVVTTLSYYLLERPFLKLKKGFAPPAARYVDRNMGPANRAEQLVADISSRSAIAALPSGT